MTLVWLAAGTLLVNLPFGWLRSRSRKFSLPWILWVHAPIPLIVAARLSLGISYAAVPLLVAAALAGQMGGGWIAGARCACGD